MPHLAQQRNGLHPAKSFFDTLPLLLTDGIARVSHRAAIDSAAASSSCVLRHVRRHPYVPALAHEIRGVEALVAAYRHAPASRNFLQHFQRGIALGCARGNAALEMLQEIPGSGRVTVGGDKGFDTADFVRECRNIWVTPHVAQNTGRRGGSAIDSRTVRHASYTISQKKRKRIEECFGWLKTIALLRKVRHRGSTLIVRAELMDGATGSQLSGCQYNRQA